MNDQATSEGEEEPSDLRYEFLPDEYVSMLFDNSSPASEVFQAMAELVHRIAPGTTVAITGDFQQSVQANFDRRDVQVSYHMQRGANLVSAKTMPRGDGGSIVYFPAWLAFPTEDEAPQETTWRIAYALHMAAHESAHALHRMRDEDAEATFATMGVSTSEEQHYIQAAGLVIEEYRAQVAAEGVLPMPGSFFEGLTDDLDAFATSILDARQLSTDDVPAASVIQDEATTNLWKALALAAAESRVRDESPDDPLRAHPLWVKLVELFWPELCAALNELPESYESADSELLERTTRAVALTIRHSETLAGIERTWEGDDAFMWWP